MHHPIRLTTGSLLKDHGLLRGLLNEFESSGDAERRKRVMRLALDFLDVHSETEDELFDLEEPASDHEALGSLAELVESTSPVSNLYYARGLELAKYLRQHMSEEEQVLLERPRRTSSPVDSRSALLGRRQRMISEIRLVLQR